MSETQPINPINLPRNLHLNANNRRNSMYEWGREPSHGDLDKWEAQLIRQIEIITEAIEWGVRYDFVDEAPDELLEWRNALCNELARMPDIRAYFVDVYNLLHSEENDVHNRTPGNENNQVVRD
ncbi:hypothetical protein SBOR_8214 [Sclerotinia borealis F-4128]|uniref:Uncharacterized protein n=1 Tax=Sclerotinia borealis (strain F-4128) TaxID=1432307 RepID=W9CA28_SCLBF|nr:hypothetical protein SBOR_8214 [Sclerotinia borealis F-4128]